MQCWSRWALISLGLGIGNLGVFRFVSADNSLSSTLLHNVMQLSQIYTPGPAMSFLTSACDFPQKLQSVMLVGRAMSEIRVSYPRAWHPSIPEFPCGTAPLHRPARKTWLRRKS